MLPDDTPVVYVDDEHPPCGTKVQLWFDVCADDCPGWIRERERRAQASSRARVLSWLAVYALD